MEIKNILFGLILLGLSSSVIATPITGSLLFNGYYTHNGTTIFDATQYTFVNPVSTLSSGTLAPLTSTGVNFNTLDINATPSQALWSQTIGATTYAYLLYSPLYITSTASSRTLSGSGLLTVTGYNSLLYNYTFTTQVGSTLGYFSFSASSVVPEPMPLALIAIGLIGIGYFNRKKPQSAMSHA